MTAGVGHPHGSRLLLGGVAGSRAHGTAHSGSDYDFRGVYLVPTRQIVGLSGYEEHLNLKEPDTQSYELSKFLSLVLSANPTVLEVLWLPEHAHVSGDAAELLKLRSRLLSTKARSTYAGYASQQFKLIGKFASGVEQGAKRSKAIRHCFRILDQGLWLMRTGEVKVRVDDPSRLFELGELGLDELTSIFDELWAELRGCESVLPAQPDVAAAEAYLLEMRHLNW